MYRSFNNYIYSGLLVLFSALPSIFLPSCTMDKRSSVSGELTEESTQMQSGSETDSKTPQNTSNFEWAGVYQGIDDEYLYVLAITEDAPLRWSNYGWTLVATGIQMYYQIEGYAILSDGKLEMHFMQVNDGAFFQEEDMNSNETMFTLERKANDFSVKDGLWNISSFVQKFKKVPKDEVTKEILEMLDSPDTEQSPSIGNLVKENEMTNPWEGAWFGKEKCSLGRNADQWSNPYTIHIRSEAGKTYLSGIYFQANEEITVTVSESDIIIDEQSLGGPDFIIRGKGKLDGNKLTIDYEVDVLVGSDTYKTNSCIAEFTRKEEGVFEVEIPKQKTVTVQLPKPGTWCLWEIQGGNRVWLEGNVPGAGNGFGKYDVYSKQLPMYLGNEKNFTLINPWIGTSINLVFRKCEYE